MKKALIAALLLASAPTPASAEQKLPTLPAANPLKCWLYYLTPYRTAAPCIAVSHYQANR